MKLLRKKQPISCRPFHSHSLYHNFLNCLLYISYKVSSENLFLNQIIYTSWFFKFSSAICSILCWYWKEKLLSTLLKGGGGFFFILFANGVCFLLYHYYASAPFCQARKGSKTTYSIPPSCYKLDFIWIPSRNMISIVELNWRKREFFYQKSKYFICLFFSCACSLPLQLLRIKNQELATCGSHVAAPVTEYACLIKMSEHWK